MFDPFFFSRADYPSHNEDAWRIKVLTPQESDKDQKSVTFKQARPS
jgi:hypothetical protein